MVPLPDLESLRCFEAAGAHLNFRIAARQVALSPPAFSDRIRRLEELLGEALFLRTTRHVELTPAGRALLPQARRVLEEAGRCAMAVKQGPERVPFSLRVGTRFELGLSWLTPALDALEALRPERSIQLHFGDSVDLLQRVQEGRLDCAITSARLTQSGFRYGVLHEEDYAFVASRKLMAKRPLRSPVDAASHVLLDLHPDLPLFRYFLDAAKPGQVWGFSRTEYLGTIAAVRQRVLLGAGVTVLPRYFIEKDLKAKRLVPLFPRVALPRDFFRLIWREGQAREPELQELAEALRRFPLR